MTLVLLFIIITWEPLYCPFEFWNFSSISWQLCPLIGWLCVSFHLFTLSRHNQSYIHKAIKIQFSSGCSGHSPCLPRWYESHVLAKGCRWLLPCFKLCELLEFKLSCECHYLISLYFLFYFFSLVVTSNCF